MNILSPNFTPDVLSVYNTDSIKFKKIHANNMNYDQMSNSVSPRLNLIYNGFDMVREKPLLGYGPGSFVYLHKKQNFPRNTEYITQPHNFIIEIVAQFGLWAWTYLLMLSYLFLRIIRRPLPYISTDRRIFIAIFLLLYPFIGAMSSSFLYINLHWWLLPFLVLFLSFSTDNISRLQKT